MLLLDKPYVSDLLLNTIEDNQLAVIRTDFTEQLAEGRAFKFLNTSKAIELAKTDNNLRILTTSENAIGWIAEHLPFLELPEKIELFKNKVKFRHLTSTLHPDFFFKQVALKDIDNLDTKEFDYPFIIKPAVGFFSMGVHLVTDHYHWQQVKKDIHEELRKTKNLYPLEVFDSEQFIIEQFIEGDEYAVDAYFDEDGQPVILNIHKHIFSSADDVSDRVYITSKEIIEDNLDEFTQYLQKLGQLTGVRNFPVHVELRADEKGTILPIEVNPMRFGGWCTTADMTWFSYGINPYLTYFNNEKPDWDKILKDKAELCFAIVVLDNSTGVDCKDIKGFDFSKLSLRFENVLELRKIDYHEYPVFGFLFTRTRQDNFTELTDILSSDLREFISTE